MQAELESLTAQEVSELLMTPEEYAGISHAKPYIFDLFKDSKAFLFYGAKHTADPDDSIIEDIKSRVTTFKPQIILVGDAKPKSKEDTQKFEDELLGQNQREVIKNRGDIGYIIRLALEQNIPWQPLEPSDTDLINHLLEKDFSKDEIFAFRGMQTLIQYQNAKRTDNLENYFQKLFEQLRQASNWKDFDCSEQNFLKIVNKIYKSEFTLERLISLADLKSYAYPNSKPIGWSDQSVINKIWETAWKFRDIHSALEVVEALKHYDKVFVLYGASHAVVQERLFNKLFGKVNP